MKGRRFEPGKAIAKKGWREEKQKVLDQKVQKTQNEKDALCMEHQRVLTVIELYQKLSIKYPILVQQQQPTEVELISLKMTMPELKVFIEM
eukprot:4237447-Prymnesium_polylepis.1